MKIGMVALGKLGCPCAVAIAMRGHSVIGYDTDPSRMTYGPHPEEEAGPDAVGDYNDWLKRFATPASFPEYGSLRFGTLKEVCEHAEIIFISVQTPHHEKYEGITRIPDERMDFDYSHLRVCCAEVSSLLTKPTPVVVISTVLPGTMRREIMPIVGKNFELVYNPFFIAMGTTMRDFLNPEFVLLGSYHLAALDKVCEFYVSIYEQGDATWYATQRNSRGEDEVLPICHPPFERMNIEDAELTKVAYNTMISGKIAFVNTLMEVCHKVPGCNVDVVTNALKKGNVRLISTAYLTGGMGDGGGCHPRDNIALSWLSRELGLKFDWFEAVMMQREKQTEWLADLIVEQHEKTGLYPVILGSEFKKETNLEIGSPSILLSNVLTERGVKHFIHPKEWDVEHSPCCLWFIGCNHDRYATMKFPEGSVVLDPHRYIPLQDGVTVIPIGVGA